MKLTIISIHVPLAGDDGCQISGGWVRSLFLSTSPLRGTTTPPGVIIDHCSYFYPRPPCGGRLARRVTISTTTTFLSTSPLRGTTCYSPEDAATIRISIHVPLAGDDYHWHWCRNKPKYFYPRPPCGGRRGRCVCTLNRSPFLSTSPLRGTTGYTVLFRDYPNISIHVPLAGDDSEEMPTQAEIEISIHVPLAGDDDTRLRKTCDLEHFYPRPPCGGRRRRQPSLTTKYWYFYPRPPCGGRPCVWVVDMIAAGFLSTSPLRGTTRLLFSARRTINKFLSTSPLRGTTRDCAGAQADIAISIHVPLAGDDGRH